MARLGGMCHFQFSLVISSTGRTRVRTCGTITLVSSPFSIFAPDFDLGKSVIIVTPFHVSSFHDDCLISFGALLSMTITVDRIRSGDKAEFRAVLSVIDELAFCEFENGEIIRVRIIRDGRKK
jgi:hypothetical protein